MSRRTRRGVRAGDVPAAASARPASTPDTDGVKRYQLRQRMLAIGDDFTITDQHGQVAYVVDGKALRLRSTLRFLDADGNQLYRLQEKVLRVRDSMSIERPDAQRRCPGPQRTAHPAARPLGHRRPRRGSPARDRDHPRPRVPHPAWRHARGDGVPAVVRARDTYGVEVAANEDQALLLAVAVVIDMMAHEGR